MEQISRKIGEVAVLPKFRLPLNLQLFAEDDAPNLEDSPEFKEDSREYEKMNAKIDKFNSDRAPKETVKEPAKVEVVIEKELVKVEEEAGNKEVATPTDKPKQDTETNKAFQEMRQKLESAEKEKAEVLAKAQKADAMIKAQFGAQGITTVEQYEQWLKQGEEEADNTRYKEAGLTEAEIEKIRKFDEIQAKAESSQKEQTQQAYLSQWESLYKAYPDIVADAESFREGKDPSFYTEEMKDEIARGASPLAAYRNAHFETILANATKTVKETATQDAVDRLSSKNHIKGNAQAAGDIEHFEVDADQMRIYRGLMKGKTDAQIRAFAKKQNVGG
jgi:hypothetical protein